MKSDNPPIKHHYIPAFYLRRWAASGMVVEFARVHGEKIVSKSKAPEATGFKERLYELKGFDADYAQQVELKYFKKVDTLAALSLDILCTSASGFQWNSENRSGWTRFLLSLLLRCPEDIDCFREWWHEDFHRTDPEGERRYQKSRKSNDPETFAEYLSSQPLSVKEAYLFKVFSSLVEHDVIGEHVNNMHWDVIDMPSSAPQLLTSDRPVIRSNNLKDDAGHIALPIGPRVLFIASHNIQFLKDIRRTNKISLIKECNRQVVEGAVRFAYACDDSQARFIKNRFGKSLQPRLMEQIIARRRSLDGGIAG